MMIRAQLASYVNIWTFGACNGALGALALSTVLPEPQEYVT